jgi:hypothetical protein
MKLPICESYKQLHENDEEADIQQAMQLIMQFVTNPDTAQDELELNDKLAMNIANATYDGSTDEFGYGWDGEIDMGIFAEALTRLFRLGKLVFDESETGHNLYIREA